MRMSKLVQTIGQRKTFKKADEICINPQHYKDLNYPLNKYKRVHIDSNLVLCFSVDEKEQTVTLVKLAHHKDAY